MYIPMETFTKLSRYESILITVIWQYIIPFLICIVWCLTH